MNLLIISSSYPACADDTGEAAGMFVRAFAQECAAQGHKVIVQPISRKMLYKADPGLIIEPIPWTGGGIPFSQAPLFNPRFWPHLWRLVNHGGRVAADTVRRYSIDRILCMWIVPSGVFGYSAWRSTGIPYDVWALGSDIWRIVRLPLVGPGLIRFITRRAACVFADGYHLGRQVENISGRRFRFMPSSRWMPAPGHTEKTISDEKKGKMLLLFVGRYHPNKGPDILLRALSQLNPDERSRLQVIMRGKGPMENGLKGLVKTLDLTDTVSIGRTVSAVEMASLLNRVDYLVIPSRIESIPVVFSDAIQLGVPVITTPVGDLPELVNRFRCGIVANSAIPYFLAEAIRQALKQDRMPLIQGTCNAAEYFDLTKTVHRWIENFNIECE